jgi:hypothetical protein
VSVVIEFGSLVYSHNIKGRSTNVSEEKCRTVEAAKRFRAFEEDLGGLVIT